MFSEFIFVPVSVLFYEPRLLSPCCCCSVPFPLLLLLCYFLGETVTKNLAAQSSFLGALLPEALSLGQKSWCSLCGPSLVACPPAPCYGLTIRDTVCSLLGPVTIFLLSSPDSELFSIKMGILGAFIKKKSL